MARARVAAAAGAVALIALLFPAAGGGFGAPATIQSGLASPTELAVASNGDLWFNQIDGDTTTLYVLPRGLTTPIATHTVPGFSRGSFLIDLALDGGGVPHFVQFERSGDRVDTSVMRLGPGGAAPIAKATGTQDELFVLRSGSSIDQVEVTPDGTVLFSVRTRTPDGDQLAQLHALAPGAAASTVIAEFAAPGRFEQIGDFDVAGDTTIYLQESSTLGAFGNGSQNVYRLAPGGAPQLVHTVLVPPGPSAVYIGLDGEGNLFVGGRSTAGLVRPGCATSSTFQLTRFAASSLAGPAPTGTVISTATYRGFVWLFLGSSSYFQVSDDGGVLFGLYPGNTRCGDPPGPTRFTRFELRGVAAGDATGTQQLIAEHVPPAPVTPVGGYAIAVLKKDAFATSAPDGTLAQLSLKDKKPKKK